jgi:hypothetical protein
VAFPILTAWSKKRDAAESSLSCSSFSVSASSLCHFLLSFVPSALRGGAPTAAAAAAAAGSAVDDEPDIGSKALDTSLVMTEFEQR